MTKAICICFMLLAPLSPLYSAPLETGANFQGSKAVKNSVSKPSPKQARSRFPAPTGHVSDFAGVIDEKTRQRLENTLKNLKRRSRIEFDLVTVETTGGQDIFEFSRQLARRWNVGLRSSTKKTLLLVVSVKEKTLFTQFSRAAQAELPEGILGEIRQRMRGPIASGQFSEGLTNGIQYFVSALAQKLGFSLKGIDQPDSARTSAARVPAPKQTDVVKAASRQRIVTASDTKFNTGAPPRDSAAKQTNEAKSVARPAIETALAVRPTDKNSNTATSQNESALKRTIEARPIARPSIETFSGARSNDKNSNPATSQDESALKRTIEARPIARPSIETSSGTRSNDKNSNTGPSQNESALKKTNEANPIVKPAPETTSAASPTRAKDEAEANRIATLKTIEIVPIPDSRRQEQVAGAGGRTAAFTSESKGTSGPESAEPAQTVPPIESSSNTTERASKAGSSPEDVLPLISDSPTPFKQAALTDNYRVGIGDVLDIRMLNSTTNGSTLYTVIDGGLVDFPLLGGPVAVAGLTTTEIQARLVSELNRRAVDEGAQLTVAVRQYASHTVTVTGLVNHQGTRVLRRETVPLYVIIAEVQPRLDAGRVTIMRAGSTLPALDLDDPATLNFNVQPGDVINITSRPKEFYYIGGRITYPGQKIFQPGITMLQAILAAGGLSRQSNHKVELLREGSDGRLTTIRFDLREIKSGRVQDPPLQSGDRLEIVQ